MTEAEARMILGALWRECNAPGRQLEDDVSVALVAPYFSFTKGDEQACLDGEFTPDQLEAIAVMLRAHQQQAAAQQPQEGSGA